jgi:hypothetical protein
MDQLYPLVCVPSQEIDRERQGRKADVNSGSESTEGPDDRLMTDLNTEVWTRPLTKREWEMACGLIMYWAMHGGC